MTVEKLYKKYDYISRYETFPYFYDAKNNRYFYGLTSNLNQDVGYVLYKVKVGDSYDSISFEHYGSPLFYWIICDYNQILDCFTTPVPGSTLKLPSLNAITFKE